jgi:hypothetical protein
MTYHTTWQGETGGYISVSYASSIPATSGYAFFVGKGIQYRLDGFVASGQVYITRSGVSSLPVGKYEMLPQVIDSDNRVYFLTPQDVEVERVLGTSSTAFATGDSILVRIAALEAASGGVGTTTFLGLTDTPDSYSGYNGYAVSVSGSQLVFQTFPAGVTDHGALTGLSDNDHPQYLLAASGLTTASGDARYAHIIHDHALATIIASGFMSAADKVKLDSVPSDLLTLASGNVLYWPLSTDLATQVELNTHESDTTNIHGIVDTSALVLTSDSRLNDSRTPTGSATGVLSGTYPSPGFAVDMATQAELDLHLADFNNPHQVTANQLGALIVASGDARYAQLNAVNTFTIRQIIAVSGIGTVSASGLVFTNTTPAAVGSQQYSPRLQFIGQGWKANATAASQTVTWTIENQPQQSNASAHTTLVVNPILNGTSIAGLWFGANNDTEPKRGLFGFDGTTPVSLDGNFGYCGFGSVGANNVFAAYVNAGRQLLFGNGGLALGSTTKFSWTSSALGNSISGDLGIYRNTISVLEVNNGTANQFGALKAGWRDSRVSTIASGLYIGGQSSGTPTTGFGIAQVFTMNSASASDRVAAQISTAWTDAIDISRTSKVSIATVLSANALTDRLQVDSGNGANTEGLMIWDVNSTSLKRVEVGDADSGGTGYRLLRIAN